MKARNRQQPVQVGRGLRWQVAGVPEDFTPLRRFADRDHANIVSWNEYDRGGHWSAQDAPDLLVDDMRAFFRTLR